jgi:hypothetical protein
LGLVEKAGLLQMLLEETEEIAFLILLLLSEVVAVELHKQPETEEKMVVLEEEADERMGQLSPEAVQQDKAMTGERVLLPLPSHARKLAEVEVGLER